MTTIAYNHKDKEIAVDGQATSGNTVVSTSTKKLHRITHGWAAFAGELGCVEGHDVVNLDRIQGEIIGLVMYDTGQVFEVHINATGRVHMYKLTTDYAVGSGREYALGALYAGASAKDAVKAAIKYDIYSSGKITVKKMGDLK